ncbi:hypothetical protein ACLBR5_02880 [Escherichia coli]
MYQAQSGLTGGSRLPGITRLTASVPLYNVEKDAYVLAEGQNELQVPMTQHRRGRQHVYQNVCPETW